MPLTDAGLTIPTQEEIQQEILDDTAAQPALNPNGKIELSPASFLFIFFTIFANKYAELWQALQSVYGSAFLSMATGTALDLVVDMLGVTRLPAAASRATISVTGVNGTIIPIGSSVRDPDRPDIEWLSLTSITIAGGVGSAVFQANTTGPIAANAGTLDSIVTPIAGWATATNAADADLGRNVETDAALRVRFKGLLSKMGSGTPPSILSGILDVAGVIEAAVFENFTDTTNAFGVPPHAIEAVVDGGDDNAVATAIYANRPTGIGTYSATGDSGALSDANGESITMRFSRPIPVDVYVYVEVEGDGSNIDLVDEVKTAVASYGDDNVGLGKRVIRSKFYGAPGGSGVYSVPGVENVLRIGLSTVDAATAEANADVDGAAGDIVVAFREKAAFDTTRIEVDVV